MFFSVVIPVYNKADVLHRTLRSVLNQTFRDFEVILVDDGSTDNSSAVIADIINSDEFKKLHLKVLSQENSGVLVMRGMKVLELPMAHFVHFLMRTTIGCLHIWLICMTCR